MSLQKLHPPQVAIGGLCCPMTGPGDRHILEVLVRLLKCADDLHGGSGVYVSIQFANDQK